MRSIFYYLLSSILIIQCSFGELPADIQKCKAGDTACIGKVSTGILQNNPSGRSDIGLPRLEPLRINSLIISDGNTGSIGLKLSFKDVDISGLSKGTFDRVVGFTEDASTSKFEMSFVVPELKFKGQYIADGKILVLPIQGKGDADLALQNVRISGKIKMDVSNKDGHVKIAARKVKALVEPSGMTIKLENLFNGDSALSTNMITFLNENWKDVWSEISPAVNNAIADVIFGILKDVLPHLNYEEIFL